MAQHDPLTGLYNRKYFDDSYRRHFTISQRQNHPLAVLMFDIDYFKRYNDRYGHQNGDKCLKAVADTLATCFRRPGDFVARYGGEEFVAMILDFSIDEAMAMGEVTRKSVDILAISHEASETSDHVTLSVGVAAFNPRENVSYTALLERADRALYEAKNTGRNRVVVSGDHPKMPASADH